MEKEITIISGDYYHNRMQEVLLETPEMQRFLYFSNEVSAYSVTTRAETDESIYWSCQSKTPKFENERLFFISKTICGATYSKKTNTIKIWFNEPFIKLVHDISQDIIKCFKLDWYEALSPGLKSLISNSLLNRMIKGKITNPDDFIKAYIKISPFRNLGVSPRLLYLMFKDDNAPSPRSIRKKLEHSTDPNKAMEILAKGTFGYSWELDDLYNQAMMLNKKVNPAWSEKRRKDVHSQWTREIMEIKVKRMQQKEYNYSPIELPEGVSLISNNYELFEEGTVMKHCIYTNYESRIENKQYFALKYDYDGVRATVGLKIDSYYDGLTATPKLIIDQMYGIGNSSINPEHRMRIEEWLNQSEVQDYFIVETNQQRVSQSAGFL